MHENNNKQELNFISEQVHSNISEILGNTVINLELLKSTEEALEAERQSKILFRKKLFDSGNHDMEPDEAWRLRAECFGMETNIFFPERGCVPEQALKTCQDCEVQDECLDFALKNGLPGIWGKTTGRFRDAMRNRLGITSNKLFSHYDT